MNNKKDYLKKKTNRKNFKGKGEFKLNYTQNEEFVEEGIPEEQSKELVKIGKHWEGVNLIEPKNTKEKIIVIESLSCFISIVDDCLKVFDINDLSLKKTIKQVLFVN
jgi:hypothetical protein